MREIAHDERIRVVVADDHPVYRGGVVRSIEERPGLELVGEAGDGREALAQIRRLQPDVAVLDVRLPAVDGIAVAALLAREELRTRVIMLSAFQDGALVYRALGAGARAYLSKDADRDDLSDTIVSVAGGQVVIPRELQAGLADEIRVRQSERQQLTAREREVLALLATGASAPEIAQRLDLRIGIVAKHLLRLHEKVDVSDRAAAVSEAMRTGLIE